MNDDVYYVLPRPLYTVVERPTGRFFGGHFYWVKSLRKAKYEEEWGWQWLDGIDREHAERYAFYNRTGHMRPIK